MYPEAKSNEEASWIDKGDWLAIAHMAGADSVFFVGHDPVIVFFDIQEAFKQEQIIEAYRKAWCMAGPRLLFIATPGELCVYGLNRPPVRVPSDWVQVKPLAARRVADVCEALHDFCREQIEVGMLTADKYFGSSEERVDTTLIDALENYKGSHKFGSGTKACTCSNRTSYIYPLSRGLKGVNQTIF